MMARDFFWQRTEFFLVFSEDGGATWSRSSVVSPEWLPFGHYTLADLVDGGFGAGSPFEFAPAQSGLLMRWGCVLDGADGVSVSRGVGDAPLVLPFVRELGMVLRWYVVDDVDDRPDERSWEVEVMSGDFEAMEVGGVGMVVAEDVFTVPSLAAGGEVWVYVAGAVLSCAGR